MCKLLVACFQVNNLKDLMCHEHKFQSENMLNSV